MSDDLVERLRNQIAYDDWNVGVQGESVARDALEEIERLRAENAHLRQERLNITRIGPTVNLIDFEVDDDG